ncbi:TetR family transcriptional regulator, partial [Streptomyces sp. SID10244]|nr:TetR family transcriptional regulator [Streptomyces sp. SID10244]
FGEAALTVISTGGLRALTHRSVDEAAGLPAGSVNYYAPTRAKLEALALTEAYEQMYAIAIRTFGPILETDDPSTDLVLD